MHSDIISIEDPRIQHCLNTLKAIEERIENYQRNSRLVLDGSLFLQGQDVCRLLHISPRTLQELRTSKRLSFYRLGNQSSKLLYDMNDVQAMLEQHYVKQK